VSHHGALGKNWALWHGTEGRDYLRGEGGAGSPIQVPPLASLQSPQVGKEGMWRSERVRKDTEAYVKEKYQDFPL